MFNLVRKYMDLAQMPLQDSLLVLPLTPLDQSAKIYVDYVYTDYKCDSNLRSICPRMDIEDEEICSANGVLCG
eukprot:753471-Hanusia_phi.AAC.4